MQATQREVVDRFLVQLKNDVIPVDTLPYLPCLTEDDREVVQHKQDREGPRAAVTILLQRLKKRSDSFEQLLEALKCTGCQHLKELLVIKDSTTVLRVQLAQTEQTGTSTPTEESTHRLKSQLSSPSQETDYSEFDMLVCYSQKDKEVAFKMRDVMDKEFKLRVCIDEVDFIPGNAISENICDFIRCSKAIVFLLTADFLEKKWSHWEMQHALLDFLDKKASPQQKKIIPVLLKECKVPDALRPYTPINFQESMDWKRLATAVQEDRGSTITEGNTQESGSPTKPVN